MQKETCCPEGSWPRLHDDYQPKGKKFEVANTTCYHIGQGNRVLVMVSDIYGATSGKHQSFADTFASFGYNVYLPQILSHPYVQSKGSKSMMDCIKHQDYNLMKQRFTGVTQYLQEKGHKKFFVIGFCWGVWFSFKMAIDLDNIIAIGGMHPALGLQNSFGGDVNHLAKQIRCPAYLFPAGNDLADIKPHGQIIKILQEKFGSDKCRSHDFPDMVHGWTVRGDIHDSKVKRDVKKAMQLCKDYFAKFQV